MPIVEDIDLFLMYVNDEEKKYAAYLAQELRLAGFIVDTEYTGRGLKGQFKQADRLNAKFTVVLNSEDLNNNEVKIKNNRTKEEEIISLDVLIYYLDEQINTMIADDLGCDCGCGCGDETCDCEDDGCSCGCGCDESCDCGCQEGGECHCHDDEDEHECCGKHKHEAGHKCKCHHEED